MKIYKDILTNDEIVSDSYNLKEIDGIVYEVDCAMIVLGADVSNDNEDAAAILSEDQSFAVAPVNNILNGFRLQPTSFDKNSYLTRFEEYIKNVKGALQEHDASADTITAFEKGARTYLNNQLLPNFRDLEFYISESENPEGLVVLLNYRADGTTPYLILWKHGLKEIQI